MVRWWTGGLKQENLAERGKGRRIEGQTTIAGNSLERKIRGRNRKSGRDAPPLEEVVFEKEKPERTRQRRMWVVGKQPPPPAEVVSEREQVTRKYIRCDNLIVTHHMIVYDVI